MATLESLKKTLGQKMTPTTTQPLSDSQYGAGFDILAQGSRWTTYQHFIVPQLALLLAPLIASRVRISVLEVGPGPKSVLGLLPEHQRRNISRYAAFEPNELFVTALEEWLRPTSDTRSPLPCLASPPDIRPSRFVLDGSNVTERFDVVLFCHSMYGMKPKHSFIQRALDMLPERPRGGIVVVFHRGETLHLDGLSCHRTASFPTGVMRVADDDEVLDCFARFVAGVVVQDGDADRAVQVEWRRVCRELGRREEAHPDHLTFSSPTVMAAFTQHATALPELTARVPLAARDNRVKNRAARLHHPASVMRPTTIRHVQQCVRWALNHGVGLTIVGGGHSGHCRWTNVVSVDMGAFDQVHITRSEADSDFVVAEAGCQTGDIVAKVMAAGLTVPLGARPSVGAGLWLQGGIGHLARLHGLSCDAIVGVVVVSVASGQVMYVGHVPSQHRPAGAVKPDNETDLLWAIKGAGTNFGVVVSVTFRAYAAPTYSVRNWLVPLGDRRQARLLLGRLDEFVAGELPRNLSVDAYLYWDTGKLRLGVTTFEACTTRPTSETRPLGEILGLADDAKTVDGVGLFETDMYMSGMHGGHGGGKTSSFKRCLFLKSIGSVNVAKALVSAVETRPSPLCYLHLLQGGGAVADVAPEATAFGCRDWDFACVITGVWSRDQDGTGEARAAVRWVYDVAGDLLPLSTGAYGADLGPDPRDAALAVKAFGPNLPRLARLKHTSDPGNVLAYACPLPKAPMEQKLIVLVTGESCAGKDYCADVWVSVLTSVLAAHRLKARAEEHRPALSRYFKAQVRQRPRLPEEVFLRVVDEAVDAHVLFITGMRDEAPVPSLSHLVPGSRLLEVRVEASREQRQLRRGHGHADDEDGDKDGKEDGDKDDNSRPSFIFINESTGSEAATTFSQRHLLPLFDEQLRRLASMVRSVPDFPRPAIEFRHVLDISQQPGGLATCTSLLQSHFAGDWAKVDAVACCEIGGLVYASALAARVHVPLALIREAGKLPPPTVSVVKAPSHVSARASEETRFEMGCHVVPRGASVVVVDDVLATGKTLCAVLQLLRGAGIRAGDVSVMVVAEFPLHRGRQLLRSHGFGGVEIRSLLVFDGV
ncbi:hypothetical protein G6O67_002017 [Ophiocordyceps sinensis]|uniref:FAD-binding PCMH-type domain-containing protein n=3 Tax=Ophiocordyceps sinensis TaxID=72228 RepID=A0A8H4PTC5_9HYPO|nr:hypothetical protein G6O67_002017 [Ophiocordyceps sinensis]